MGDPFESVLDLEEQHIEEGFEAGRRDGLAAGLQEGRELGLQKGFEIGLEVGHYAGCVRAWRALQRLDPSALPARAERGIAALEGLLAAYPLYDPQARAHAACRTRPQPLRAWPPDQSLQDALEALRARCKAVVATMGATAAFGLAEGASGAGGAAGGGQGRQPVGGSLAF
ncbi:hypothetical protein Rsub_09583 [Raphidocelis subcapitata]|uniref:Essential protein Yae1 N-terminal domain-containing protein n=1 Tax=Raphidocelis subcapitata TaxID=307507 RepID=A0A2V0PJC7_9CHLO|nr:hypothetical protein Rsub_09583 [Raphidocelis subcapitata]|eukprot:GBF97417.1 hypothetical protein Rsub_09583 [Raphidocelis subcapitata]